jgi:hypothetical protein
MRAARSLLSISLTSLVAAGCVDPPAVDVPPECNPLGGAGCLAPWPSSAYLRDDETSPTGVRFDVPPGAFPTTTQGIDLDVALINQRTGFSPATQIVTAFPGGVDPSNLPFWTDYAASLGADSPTVILDMATGERVAHFAEVDANYTYPDKSGQALYLRPAARLKGARRYAVAIRRSLKRADGGELESPPGFQYILDGERTVHGRLERVRGRTEEVIAALARAGISSRDLVVAWDFVTADDASVTGDTLAARDVALAAMGERGAGVGYRVTREVTVDDPRVARIVEFELDSPRVLADGGVGLHRDASGRPAVNGTIAARAVAVVPVCTTPRPPGETMPVLLYGHGFFGDLEEPQGRHARRVAADLCMVIAATEWRGMSQSDLDLAVLALSDPNYGIGFGESLIQGIVDFIALGQAVRGPLARELLVEGGASIVDPERVFLLGVSQGHILGSTFFAYDPGITRAVQHVGGAQWSLLFERSLHWATFSIILTSSYSTEIEVVLVQQLMQMVFDPTDPIHVSPAALAGGVPGTPRKQWLLQESDSDPAVSNLATEVQARTMGLPVMAPALRVPFGIAEAGGPAPSGLAIFTERPQPPRDPSNINEDGEGNVAHVQLRRRRAVVEQMKTFFATGEVVPACGAAVCDCAAGACGPLD